MATTSTINLAAFEKEFEEQRTNIKAEGDAQVQKMAVLGAQPSRPAALISSILGVATAAKESLAVPEVPHEEFTKTMDAMRLHYTGAPGTAVASFRLSEQIAKPPMVLSALRPTGTAPAPHFIVLTKEGTDATNQLLLQCHKEMMAAVQTHAGAVLDTLKTYGQSQNLAAFNAKMEATRAALKAQVNAFIDKTINLALAVGAKHTDQHSALASIVNKIGQFFGGVAHGIEGAVQGAAHTVANAAKDVGKAVVSAAKDVGHAVSSAVSSIGHFFGL